MAPTMLEVKLVSAIRIINASKQSSQFEVTLICVKTFIRRQSSRSIGLNE